MDFNIRAISLAESVDDDTRIAVADVLGKEILFRSGISISITLPESQDRFECLPEPERLLTVLDGWTRVFRYPEADYDSIHIVAAADNLGDEILFYRIDLRQPPPSSRRAPRSAVEIVGGAIMSHEQCADWLIDLSFKLDALKDAALRPVILSRPRQLKPKQIRLAWIGPEILEGVAMPARLQAIGKVHGAEIIHIPPRRFQDVQARLRKLLPLEGVIISDHFAPYIGREVVPNKVRQDLVHVCNSRTRADLEGQIRTWTEVVIQETEKQSHDEAADENHTLLKIMLQGMLSHSKIGQFNHCPKTTVLKGIRGLGEHPKPAIHDHLKTGHR